MKDKVTIIIPVHNLIKRGLKRVLNSVYSLNFQREFIEDIIIVDSSNELQFNELDGLLKGLDVIHVHLPNEVFNKPKLLNKGVSLSKSKYVMCTDADYLFKVDFLKVCEKYRGEKVMLFKEVKMLPNMRINKDAVKVWNFPNSPFNQWGKLANGACQYSTKDFFTKNPYPEQMEGFGAMDNLMAYVSYKEGFQIKWVKDSEILHQWHPIENKMFGKQKAKFKANQKYLEDYRKKYNIPKLL